MSVYLVSEAIAATVVSAHCISSLMLPVAVHSCLTLPAGSCVRTCVSALRACCIVGLLVTALALRWKPGPLVAMLSAVGLKLALPETLLLGAAHSSLVVGAT